MSNKIYYYVTGNTAKGLVNYLSSNIEHTKQIIILNHKSKMIKTRILKDILAHYNSQNNNVEVLCSPLGIDFLEGIIIKDRSIAIISNTITNDNYSYATEIDISLVIENKEANQQLMSQIDDLMSKAYDSLSKGLSVHDQLEKLYIQEMDFTKADTLANECIHNLLRNVPKQHKTPHVNHRLFGSTTKDGVKNVIPKLIESIKKRYYIKGRAGTGKSYFMNQIARACIDHGLDVELYHCSFDPKSIDMVIIPEINTCLFDSTEPHEFFPNRDDDVIIDLYAKTVTKGTDEKHALEISRISKEYKNYVKMGQSYIQKAGIFELQLEQEYMNEVDEISIEKAIKYVFENIK